MATELDQAIEALERELQNIGTRAVEIKKTVNQLLFLNGSGPRYTDIESDAVARRGEIEPRQFVGKDLFLAAKEVIVALGGKAYSAKEILEALEKGDFDFPRDWKAKLRWKNLAIFLGSKKEAFVSFETKEGKIYGLAEKYPERKRELDRLSKGVNNKPPDEVKPEE